MGIGFRAAVLAALIAGLAPAASAQMMMSAPPDTTAGATSATSATSAASAATPTRERWSYLVSPYFLAPNMDGVTGIGGITTDVDADPVDVFDKLQFGAMLYAQATKGWWTVAVDWIYMDLGQDGTTALGASEVDLQQTGLIVTGLRKVTTQVEVMAGLQLNSLRAGITTTGPTAIDRSDSRTWVDPIIGFRNTLLDRGKWRFSLTGDIGGFGIGSDLTWQLYTILSHRTSEAISLAAGYRALGIDYETGSGSDAFVYDMVIFGPEIGIGFHF